MDVTVATERWQFARQFRIAYSVTAAAEVIVATLTDGIYAGRGEAAGIDYRGETVDSMTAQILSVRDQIAAGIDQETLQELLPPGGARNALDCALWDLSAKHRGLPVWELAGLKQPRPLHCFFTIGLDDPEEMARQARAKAATGTSLLKLKLGGTGDLDRVRAVRSAVPKARLIVDANESWNPDQLAVLPPALAQLGVELIEQPLPAGADDALRDYYGHGPVPVCADESCQTSVALESLVGKYDMLNIKLDKTGGLTEALRLRERAIALGFRLMVGNMCGTSLAMAPAFLIGGRCDVVDLDGPLLNVEDRPHGLRYQDDLVWPPVRDLWG